MSTQENVVSLKNCLEHHLMEIQWFSQKAVQKNCLISSMPRRAKSVALSRQGKSWVQGGKVTWRKYVKVIVEMLSQTAVTKICNQPTFSRVILPQTCTLVVKSSLHCRELAEPVFYWTHYRKRPLTAVKIKRGSRVGLWRGKSQDTGCKVNQENNPRLPSVRCVNYITSSFMADFKTLNNDLLFMLIHNKGQLYYLSFLLSSIGEKLC